MRAKRVWFFLSIVLGAAFLAVQSAEATSYIRGYVKPSGDGDTCSSIDPSNPSTPSCVDGSGNTLVFGNSLSPTTYSLVQVGVTPGATVDFTFTSLPGLTDFQVVACGYGTGEDLDPGIYTSSDANLHLPCTALGDPNNPSAFTDPGSFINDLTGMPGCPADTVCYNFSGSGLPFTWVFSEISGAPQLLSLTETFGQPPVTTPEPASLSLLALGLLGAGALRRKLAK